MAGIGRSGGGVSVASRGSSIGIGVNTAGVGGGIEARISSPGRVTATFNQAEGIRAAASRAGFTTPRIGTEGIRTAGPALTFDRGRTSDARFSRVDVRRPVQVLISDRDSTQHLDKPSLRTPERMQDREPGTGAYEAFPSRL